MDPIDILGANRLMRVINQSVIICLTCLIIVCGCIAFLKLQPVGGDVSIENIAITTDEPKVAWFDDFLGVNLLPNYVVSLAGSGSVKMSPSLSIGGVVVLSTTSEQGVARLRFGEDPGTGPFDVRNFSAEKNMTYKARVLLNANTNLQATVGLIGLNDPDHVIAVIYNAEPGDKNAKWLFEVIDGANRTAVSTGFQHTPNTWFTVKIVTAWGSAPSARIYINDATEPSVTINGRYVPGSGLCPEFQVWNKQLSSGWSQSSLYVDYLSISQDR